MTTIGELVRYLVTSILLLIRVTGQFHIIVGILHLFGFNLPETNYRYFLASNFTDFWRRANIYWKDFMLKVVYYPTYFRLRKWDDTFRLIFATVLVFLITWFLHGYQWYWLRGSFLLSWPDVSFWGLFGLLVLANTLYEARHGRKRRLSGKSWSARETAWRAVGTVGTFATITFLWSLWTSPTIGDWLSLWSVLDQPIRQVSELYPLFLVVGTLVVATFGYSRIGAGNPGSPQRGTTFSRAVLSNGVLILVVYMLGNPVVFSRLGQRPAALLADLRVPRLSDRDADLLLRGYYENLVGVNRFNTELWEVYSKRPADWPNIQETEAARLTDDFLIVELVPSTSINFHGAKFSTNRWGMRDRNYEQVPPPNTYRIALLGPSFVMGSGVSDEEVFDWILEDRLEQSFGGTAYDHFEILNFGVAGYSALQELTILEDKALAFEPNAVFLVGHQSEEQIVIRNLVNRILSGVEIPYDYLTETARIAGVQQGMQEIEATRRLKPYGTELVSWTYRQIAEISQAHGITPVYIFLPTLEQPLSIEQKNQLLRLAEEAGFITLDLSNTFENQEVASIIVAEWDKHPNTIGHRLIAEHLYDALLENQDAIPFATSK